MLLYEYRAPRRNENRIELRRSESQVRSCRQGKWDDGEKLFRAACFGFDFERNKNKKVNAIVKLSICEEFTIDVRYESRCA